MRSPVRSMASAAVQEKSAAPWPSPVSAEKYSKTPGPVDEVDGPLPQRLRQLVLAVGAQAFDDHPVRVHPGGPLPVARRFELR